MIKNVFHRENSLFFRNFIYRPGRSQRNELITCPIYVKIHFGPLYIAPLRLSYSITQEKIGRNNVYVGKTAFFSKNPCFYQPLWRYRNDLLTCITFLTCDKLFRWKKSFFSKFFCFQRPLRCYRKDLINWTTIAKIPCEA